ncbi:hypothetical protein CF328_g4617 [Tilletia controversa]|nr:hypothetical protein CF328_g4617 [Tilletia controversa]
MCIPKAKAIKDPKKLLNSCYPGPKLIASTAPEYRPSGNELSRLAYFASNAPTQLTTVGELLVQRANLEAKAFKSANGPNRDKAKAGLMLTLAITKNLIAECKRELNYFNPHAQSIISIALDASTHNPGGNTKRDIEISARTASTFYALATFTQAAGSSVDANVGKTYLELVRAFAAMCEERDGDSEDTNRIRLIAIGALSGAVGSDLFFGKTHSEQARQIVPALLASILPSHSVTLSFLQSESAKVSNGGSPQYSEFISQKRQPIQNRRAPSLSGHVDGEKGPTTEDIASAAMSTLRNVMAHGDSSSAITAVEITLAWLDGRQSGSNVRTLGQYWDKTEWAAWLSASLSNWSALQYRFVVLTHLVEHLVENCDGEPSTQHRTLIAMITAILTSSDSLIGLNTAETVNNLLGLIVRRVHHNTKDTLLAPLVDSVSSLGAHVYYADQIQDIAEEICARLTALQVPATANGNGDAPSGPARLIARKPTKPTTPVERDESMRALLTCLIGVMKAANKLQQQAATNTSSAIPNAKRISTLGRATSRNRISPGVFHQTAALLAFPNPALRLTYEQTLLTFVSEELEPAVSGAGALFAGVNDAGASQDPDALSLAHSLAAGIYTLLLAKALFVPTTIRDSPLEGLVAVDSTNTDESRGLQANPDAAALPTDYAAVADIIEALIDGVPVAATLALVPMLAALDRNVNSRLEPTRKGAARTVLARAFAKLAKTWEAPSLEALAKTYPTSALVPVPEASATFTSPISPAGFSAAGFSENVRSSSFVNIGNVAADLSKSSKLQSAAQTDEKSLASWFGRDWNVAGAVSDSFNASAPGQRKPTRMERRASISSLSSPRTKLHASHTADGSQGNDGPGDRQVGVDDFREALNATHGAVAGGNGPNGTLTRSTSRRFSRKVEDGTTDGASSLGQHETLAVAGGDVAALLDRMHVGVADEPSHS